MVSDKEPQGTEVVETNAHEDNGALADIMAAVEASEKEQIAPADASKTAEPVKETTDVSRETKAAGEAVKPEPTQEAKGPDPLANWKQADKERFKELPEWGQQFILDREKYRDAALNKKMEEIADFRKEYGAVDEMFAPYKAQLSQSGLSPYGVIQAWMNLERGLMNGQGEQIIRDIAKTYKIDLGRAVGAAAPAAATELTEEQKAQKELEGLLNPLMAPLQARIDELQKKLADTDKFRSEVTNTQTQESLRRVQNEIQSFANATNDKNELLHPYFKDVEEDMGLLAQSYKAAGKPVVLKELYDYAVWANTSTRERLLAAQQRAAAQKSTEEARAKAVAARKAGSSVTGSPATGQIRNGRDDALSVRQALEAAFEESNAR